MKYLPLANSEKEALLREMNFSSVDDLFRSIPAGMLVQTSERLPRPMSEIELRESFRLHGSEGKVTRSFMGGNGHFHYIPSVIDPLISRGEFLTAYTPYQPEVSQGTLQSMFEYQSMMSELMGVEVSNASLYDGSTAMVEACLMASRITGGDTVLVAEAVYHEYLETLKTYTEGGVLSWKTIASDENGHLSLDDMKAKLAATESVAAIVVQSPNRFGLIEDIQKIKDSIPGDSHLLISVTTEAMSLALLKSPGRAGADIVCGEAQSFGIPLSFGGPWLGFIGTSGKNTRALPGRIVGETLDKNGKVAYVVTLVAREQHIRREKATSNICTNQGLMSLRCSIYLSVMGPEGLRRAAERSHRFAVLARKELVSRGVKVLYNQSPIFNEFVIETRKPAKEVFASVAESTGMAPGTIVGENKLLSAFDETMSPEIVKSWVDAVTGAGA